MNDLLNLGAWREVLVAWLTEFGGTIAAFLPQLAGTICILLVGWAVSRLVGTASRRILRRLGFDRAAARIGISEALKNAGISSDPSGILGRLLFWLLMLTFVLSAAEALGLTAVTVTIDRFVSYLPNIIGAALIVVLGYLLARLAGSVVSATAASANVAFARQLGAAAQGGIALLVGIIALDQLGVDTKILLVVVAAAVASLTLGMGFAFAVGSRDIVRGLLAGHYLRQSLRTGEEVEVEGRRGTVERVGPVETTFSGDGTSWSIPNARLLDAVILR